MKDFVILSDTTCDLGSDVRKDFNIELINAHYMNKDGKDMVSFCDWKNSDEANDFYKALKSNPNAFSTSAPSVLEMTDYLLDIVDKGKDVLIFAISSVMSGTYNLYNQAKANVIEKYPDAKIYVIDTLRFGGGIGLMEVNASILRESGKSIEEVYEIINNSKDCYHQMGWLDDLSFVAKKGRITQSKAFFGTLIGIKPLGECNQNGLTTVLGKAKGEKQAYQVMIEYIKETIVNPSEQIILISHSQRGTQALEYKHLIEEKFNPKKVYITECGPSTGINIGPGLLSAYYVGAKLSDELVKEKEIMENILTK